ncbi:hypothetical protein A6R68_15954, partial [Neotoma lepida]
MRTQYTSLPPKDCKYGEWNGRACECKSGYTGQLCDSVLYSFPVEIPNVINATVTVLVKVIHRNFTADLKNKSSQAYQDFKNLFLSQVGAGTFSRMDKVYEGDDLPEYKDVTIRELLCPNTDTHWYWGETCESRTSKRLVYGLVGTVLAVLLVLVVIFAVSLGWSQKKRHSCSLVTLLFAGQAMTSHKRGREKLSLEPSRAQASGKGSPLHPHILLNLLRLLSNTGAVSARVSVHARPQERKAGRTIRTKMSRRMRQTSALCLLALILQFPPQHTAAE